MLPYLRKLRYTDCCITGKSQTLSSLLSLKQLWGTRVWHHTHTYTKHNISFFPKIARSLCPWGIFHASFFLFYHQVDCYYIMVLYLNILGFYWFLLMFLDVIHFIYGSYLFLIIVYIVWFRYYFLCNSTWYLHL